MKKTELKPCPFCGGVVDMLHNCYNQHFIHCLQCEAIVWIGNNLCEEDVKNKWNARTKNEII